MQRIAAPTTVVKQYTYPHLAKLVGIILLAILITFWISLGLWKTSHAPIAQHYVYLAEAMLHGRLDVATPPSFWVDFVVMPDGKLYVPFGPLPALVMVPGVLVWGLEFRGGLVSYAITILNAFLIWKVLARAGILSRERKMWLTTLFLAGTVYLSMLFATGGWYQAQVITVTLLFAAILETLGKKRPLLIGVYLGAIILTRITAVFAIPFFLIMLYDGNFKQYIWRVLKLGPGLVAAFLMLLGYNYARFGSPFETGYQLATLGAPVLDAARGAGLFSLVHVPKNLYAMLLLPPQAYPDINAPVLQYPYLAVSLWGLGLFWNTPALLLAFQAQHREKLVLANWAATIAVAIPLCLYYGIGYYQNGYRYALDFLPFLFLNAALVINKKWGTFTIGLIVLSIIITLWAALFMPALGLMPSV